MLEEVGTPLLRAGHGGQHQDGQGAVTQPAGVDPPAGLLGFRARERCLPLDTP